MSFPVGCLAQQKTTTAVQPIRVRTIVGSQIHGRYIWNNTETLTFSSQSLERLRLPGGYHVKWTDASREIAPGVIVRQELDGSGIWKYIVRTAKGDKTVPESSLSPLFPTQTDPLFLLRNLQWSDAGDFAHRAEFQSIRRGWTSETHGLPSLLGARVQPLPHQIAAVRRILGQSSPRFLLADEVGLGKTIEAGFALKALVSRDPTLKVLVVTPGAMSRQWLAELYLRFGAEVFTLLDQGVLQDLDEDDADAAFSEAVLSNRLIVSASLLADRPSWCKLLGNTSWDAVVVDEAHRYPRRSPLYSLMTQLSRSASIFLALSATPSRNDLAGLEDLLHLINPRTDAAPLAQQISERREIWFAIHNTRQLLRPTEEGGLPIQELCETIQSFWEFITEADSKLAECLQQLKVTKDLKYAHRLVSFVQERYRIDHRLVRSRREWVEQSIGIMASRRRELLISDTLSGNSKYQSDTGEQAIARHLAEFAADQTRPHAGMLRAVLERLCMISPTAAIETLSARKEAIREKSDESAAQAAFRHLFDEPEPALERRYLEDVIRYTPRQQGEARWLEEALNWAVFWKQQEPVPSRFRAVVSWVREFWTHASNSQILMFVQDARVVHELCSYLRNEIGDKFVDEFRFDRSQVDLERVAREFQQRRLRILVSDELGGEGRNFQGAAAVIHVDLPWAPSRVEQRIGRLDRIGRPSANDVLSVICCGPSPFERGILSMLDETFGVFERTIGPIEFRLTDLRQDLCRAISAGPETMSAVRPQIASAIQMARKEDDDIFEAALQLSQDELDEGKELVQAIQHAAEDSWRKAAVAWARELGITCESQVNGSFFVQMNPDRLHVDVAGVGSTLQKGVYGTFKRTRALADESLHLFGPGHPFIDALEILVEKSSFGRASVGRRNLGEDGNGRTYALFHLMYEPDFSFLAGKPGRAMVELAVLRHSQPGTEWVAFVLPDGNNPNLEVAPKNLLNRMIERQSHIGGLAAAELVAMGSADFVYELMNYVEQASVSAFDWLRQRRQDPTARAVQKFNEATQVAMEALRIRIDEGDRATAARSELQTWQLAIEAIHKEKITIDGVQLIFTKQT